MRFLLIRNEKSIRDVADRAYKGLTAKKRQQVEAALLKANPALKTFRSVRKGFIVRVPAIRDGGTENRRNIIDPVADITQELIDDLSLFENSLPKKFSKLEDRQKDTLDKRKAGNKELKKQPSSNKMTKALRKHVAESKKLNVKNKKLVLEALEKLQKAASAFDR